MAKGEVRYTDPVLEAMKVSAAYIPRLMPSAQREFAEIVSREVGRDEWHDVGGEVLRDDGVNMLEHLCECIAARTDDKGLCGWKVPEEVIAANDATWTGPAETALFRQGERWKTIYATFPEGQAGKAAATKMLQTEAALYGCKVGFIAPGVAPGKEKKEGAAPKLPGQGSRGDNPWSPNWRGNPEDKLKSQLKIISSKGGPAQAASLARQFNVDLAGRPLAAGKKYS